LTAAAEKPGLVAAISAKPPPWQKPAMATRRASTSGIAASASRAAWMSVISLEMRPLTMSASTRERHTSRVPWE